ncbi:GNAT family N-acetyltransferase [Rhizobium terrae]|uniref:GNAT family N-acetyltransferase n=1 Tax=Rhizobium terrae TaxID=2171756 RepID=UPI001D0226F2|nr:GNAT family N-acetyltransferase [Rhizobium terrae]
MKPDTMRIRAAESGDVIAISEMLQQLVAVGKRSSPIDPDFVTDTYIHNPHGILCSLAEDDDGQLLGFQSLIRAHEDNRYGTPVGWGIIGTHVSPLAARRGVGSRLFETIVAAAVGAGLDKIEAFITSTNLEAQAFYEKIGFRTHRIADGAVCKVWST